MFGDRSTRCRTGGGTKGSSCGTRAAVFIGWCSPVLDANDVTAVLITRGDQPEMIARIQDTLLDYAAVVIWDNSVQENRRIYSRFLAMAGTTDVCYTQDDDCIVPRETQQALLDAYEPGVITSNYGHGDNDGGYGDLPL